MTTNTEALAALRDLLSAFARQCVYGDAADRINAAIEIEKAFAAVEAERDELREHLQFVERWANHHGQKPHTTPAEILSVIQHYPPIEAITRGYADGKVPDTPNPWAERDAPQADFSRLMEKHNNLHANAAKDRAERDALVADAERYRWLVSRPCDGDDEFYISAEGSNQANSDGWWALGGDMTKSEADAYIDAAMKDHP